MWVAVNWKKYMLMNELCSFVSFLMPFKIAPFTPPSIPKGLETGCQRYPCLQITINFQKKHAHVWIWTTTEGVWLGFLFRPHYAASSLSFPLWISVLPHCFASLLGCLLLCLPKKKFQLFNELFLLHLLVRGRKLLIARGVLKKILPYTNYYV